MREYKTRTNGENDFEIGKIDIDLFNGEYNIFSPNGDLIQGEQSNGELWIGKYDYDKDGNKTDNEELKAKFFDYTQMMEEIHEHIFVCGNVMFWELF